MHTQAANRLWIEPVLHDGSRSVDRASNYKPAEPVSWQKYRLTKAFNRSLTIEKMNLLSGRILSDSATVRGFRGSLLMLAFRRGCRFNERIGYGKGGGKNWNYFFQPWKFFSRLLDSDCVACCWIEWKYVWWLHYLWDWHVFWSIL